MTDNEVKVKSIYRVDDNETMREGTVFEAINDVEAKRSFVKSLMGIHKEFKNKLVLTRIASRNDNGTYSRNHQIIMTGLEVENKETFYNEKEVQALLSKAKEEWNKEHIEKKISILKLIINKLKGKKQC